jgi:hypothetical protein
MVRSLWLVLTVVGKKVPLTYIPFVGTRVAEEFVLRLLAVLPNFLLLAKTLRAIVQLPYPLRVVTKTILGLLVLLRYAFLVTNTVLLVLLRYPFLVTNTVLLVLLRYPFHRTERD